MARPNPILTTLAAAALASLAARAQVTNSSMTVADAFLCTGSPNYESGADLTGVNFGAAGTLAIAPAASAKGEFQSVIRFDLASAPAQFNAAYGTNRWSITGIFLDLTSNYGISNAPPNNPLFNPISGGRFVIEWLADDDWVEGTGTPSQPTTDGVTYDSLPELLAPPHVPLCTNTYVPPGNNVHVLWPLPLEPDLLANATHGGMVSFRFYAADNQVGYLFNSYKYGRGNEPLLHVVAAPLPLTLAGVFTNGVFHLTGLGAANAAYTLQSATNLAAAGWSTLGTLTADGSGWLVFDDTNAAAARRRFYRLVQ